MRRPAAIAAALVATYWLTQRGLPGWLEARPRLNLYVAQPMLWGAFAFAAHRCWRSLPLRPPRSRVLALVAVLAAGIHAGVWMFTGLVWGMARSPIPHGIVDVAGSVVAVGTLLVATELARAYLVHAWRPRGEGRAFAATAVLLFVVATPLSRFTSIDGPDRLFPVVWGLLIPALAVSVVATWLVRHGGPSASIAYRAVLLGVEWYAPRLPDLGWPLLAAVGIVGPALAAWAVAYVYGATEEGRSALARSLTAPWRPAAALHPAPRPP